MTAQLYTQCRGCGEIFSLTTEALTCAYGRVRCSVCGTVFNALDTLTDHLTEGDLPLHAIDNAPPLLQHPEEEAAEAPPTNYNPEQLITSVSASVTGHDGREEILGHEESVAEAHTASRAETEASPVVEEAIRTETTTPVSPTYWPASAEAVTGRGVHAALDPNDEENTPPAGGEEALTNGTGDLFEPLNETIHDLSTAPAMGEEARVSNWNRWWGLAAVVMLAGLLWQTGRGLHQGRIVLPVHSPWAKTLCEALDCPSPQAQKLDLSRIATISSSIRPHPGRDDSLIVSTTFMNTAEQPMPFPALQVTLSDLDGHPVAMRRFLPGEYLPENLRQAPMLPQTLIPVTLEILKPEGQANAFQIEFSQPGGAIQP